MKGFQHHSENKIRVNKPRKKKDGIYITLDPDERQMVDDLKSKRAINMSAAFRIFIRQLWEREAKN